MRITFNSQYRDAQSNLQVAGEQLVSAQRQVSSGKRVEKPSDDPSAASRSVGERAEVATVKQYQRAADNVSSRLSVIDTVMSDMINRISGAQVSGTAARGSEKTAAEREAAALELEGIRAALVDDFNTTLNGTFVFAGAKSTTRPYTMAADGTVAAYAGSTDVVDVKIDRERSATVGYNGQEIAGAGGSDVFGVINDLIAAIRAGDDDAIGVSNSALSSAFDRVTAAQTRVGVNMSVVDSQKLRLEEMRQGAKTRLGKLEDANMAEAITGMSQADTAYKAALGAIGATSRVSLLDYLG